MKPTLIVCFASVFLMAVLLFLCGCRTNGVRQDTLPPEVSAQCIKARAEAVRNYTAHYGAPARIPPVQVVIVERPPMGKGAITSGAGAGYRIEIWRGQKPFYGSMVHEFEHTLRQGNGKGSGEGW